jgi:phage baseplate assembly protein V
MITVADIAKLLRPLQRRIMLTIGRGTLTLTDDANGQQRAQVTLLDGEVRDAVDRVQQYGLSASAPPGATVVVVCVGGSRDHPIIIAVDEPRARPTGGKSGEVMLYSAFGQRILLREDAGLEITTPAGVKIELSPDQIVTVEAQQLVVKAAEKVRIESPVVQMTGALTAASVTEGPV